MIRGFGCGDEAFKSSHTLKISIVDALQDASESWIGLSASEGKPVAKSSSWLLGIAGFVWLALVLTGSFFLLQYAQSPGADGTIPDRWPGTIQLSHDGNHPTLIMFIHPRCPCSRATLGELEVLMARCQGKLDAQVWFLQPAGMSEVWVKTDLWRSAEVIPGVTVHRDEGGMEARRFHAETSGQAALYDSDGTLMFQGGITISRGHAGDNAGLTAVAALVAHEPSRIIKTAVYGCALADANCQQGGATCER